MTGRSVTVLVCLFLLVGCSSSRPPEAEWAEKRETADGPVSAVVEISRVEALPGQRVDVRLTVNAPAGGVMESPLFNHAGLEPVDMLIESLQQIDGGTLQHRVRWILQAGPPGVLTGQTVRVTWSTHQLELLLPPFTIHSAFAQGAFTNALPPLRATP